MLKLLVILLFVAVLPVSVFAYNGVSNGSTVLNSSQNFFNFTTGLAARQGHITIVAGSFYAGGNASIRPLGMFSSDLTGQEFFNNFARVPNASSANFYGNVIDYTTGQYATYFPGNAVAVRFLNSSGHVFYGTIFVRAVTNNNVSISFKFNNQSVGHLHGNETFGAVTGCAANLNFSSCVSDTANDCSWSDAGLCLGFGAGEFSDIPPAECEMLPKKACDGISNTFCSWNSAASGGKGQCQRAASFNSEFGFNCSAIINHSVCTNQSFTQKTGLCTWWTSSSLCALNRTKTLSDVPAPPVFSCEATGYVNNQTKCEQLADQFYLPCGWNNISSKCEALFFDFGKFEEFDDISSSDTCQMMGGTWKTDTAFDPFNNKVTSESWCELGSNIKTFDDFGGGVTSFGGSIGQLNDCGQDCFACEFNSTGGRWPNISTALSQCTASAAGCTFRNDSNAFSGYGWCEPVLGFGGVTCDASCGACNLQPSPQNACTASPADCKWDNVTQNCIESGQKSCAQDCFQCDDQLSCGNSTASGGCSWDASSSFCKPKGGTFEICFDGIDNDNNAKIDCADFKCSSDPFCGGSTFDSNNCFQYDSFEYGTSAQGKCTNATGCSWATDSFNFSYCAPLSEQCFLNTTLQTDATLCNTFGTGSTCEFKTSSVCLENTTMMQSCFSKRNNTDCAGTAGCAWDAAEFGGGFCDLAPIVTCEENETLQTNQSLCDAAGCAWVAGQFSGFEGGSGLFNNCVSPCLDPGITTQAQCANATANATSFYNGTCVWQTGFCEQKNSMGNCIQNDGDKTACLANSNCKWFEDPVGGVIRNPNGSTNFNDNLRTSVPLFAFGLQHPLQTGQNRSVYTLISQWANITLVQAADSRDNVVTWTPNVTQILCNSTAILQYNWSSDACMVGKCNQFNGTLCGGGVVYYYFSNLTGAVEAYTWQTFSTLSLDGNAADEVVTTLLNSTTVIIDGNLSEQFPENATARDGTNATRSKIVPGFCDSGLTNTFFAGFDNEPPIPIASDPISGPLEPSAAYLDISGLGVKKTPEAYMYGIPLLSADGTMLCNGMPLRDRTSLGSGTNTSKYYLYLDTNGIATGGCAAVNNVSVAGFEYSFRYVAERDSTGKLKETLLSMQCSGGSWVATNVPFKSDKQKGCGFVGGPIFGVDKDTLTSKSDVNTSKSWRAYAASAAAAGNASNVSDTVGPGSADFKGIDAEVIDCMSTQDKDNPACTKFKQFGFFPGEFGPACTNARDDDGDGATDCSDFDCKYDPFFCSGSFASLADDSSSPSFVWTKVNSKNPTALNFIFDTNEPANGSVKFYNNDTTCGTINTTVKDSALGDGDSHTDYRPHHVADLAGLVRNTTYFYKLVSCDPSGNCAVSSCSNVTTALSHTNITFKVDIPENWTMDIPAINLTNFTDQYAIKASTERLSNINVTVKAPDNVTSITFIGVDIFEKQTINVSEFSKSTTFIGLDSNQYQSLKQRTGIDKAVVTIPTTGSILQHCDDNGTNCKDVTSKVSCTFGATSTVCQVPDAVGLGFSTYKSVSTSSTSSSSGSSGSGGSGSAGAAAAVLGAVVASASHTWDSVAAGSIVTLDVANNQIAVTSVEISSASQLSNFKVAVGSYASNVPPKASEFGGSAHQYLEIIKTNAVDSDINSAVVKFEVPSLWINEQGASPADVALYRYIGGSWKKLSTAYTGLSADGSRHVYTASTPGFSFFVVGVEKAEAESSSAAEDSSSPPTEAEAAGEAAETAVGEDQAESRSRPLGGTILLMAAVIGIIAVAAYLLSPKKKR